LCSARPSQAFEEIFTLTYVTARTVGIGGQSVLLLLLLLLSWLNRS
jgi:hypothetical protein